MPRKLGTGGAPNVRVQNQPPIARGDDKAARPSPEQAGSSRSSGKSSAAPRAREQGKALRLQRQLKEAEIRLAEEWGGRLDELFTPIPAMEDALDAAIDKATEDFERGQKTKAMMESDPRLRDRMEKLALAQFDRSLALYDKAVSDFDQCRWNGCNALQQLTAAVERLDALPNKDRLFAVDSALKAYAEDVKARLSESDKRKTKAAHGAQQAMVMRAIIKDDRIDDGVTALIAEMRGGNFSDAVRNRVQALMEDLDAAHQEFSAALARGLRTVEACDRLLADPHLDAPLKAEVREYRNSALFNNATLRTCSANCTERKTRMLTALARDGNRAHEASGKMQEWRTSMVSLLHEYQAVLAVNSALMGEERSEYLDPGAHSEEALAVRLQAAVDGTSQFERIVRGCKKLAADYADLEGVVKDDRMVPVLNEMAERVAECMRGREYAGDMWTEKIRTLERTKSAQASFAPQVAAPRPAPREELHRTKDGVVLGNVNKHGGLDGVDRRGQVISTYFKDPDGGGWVRDYGDASDASEAVSSSSTSGTSGTSGTPSASDKAEGVVRKARRAVEASSRFSEDILARVARSGDYDDKVQLLLRAYSDKARTIAKVSAALVDLKDMPRSAGAGDDAAAGLREALASLRKEKSQLDGRLQKVQSEMAAHSHKTRDPNEASFRFLMTQGEVASITKELNRRQNRDNARDWLDRYVVSFAKGAQGEKYDPWIVHAHYDSADADAAPSRVHMKRYAERDWGKDRQAYHSRPIGAESFSLIRQKAQSLH